MASGAALGSDKVGSLGFVWNEAGGIPIIVLFELSGRDERPSCYKSGFAGQAVYPIPRK